MIDFFYINIRTLLVPKWNGYEDFNLNEDYLIFNGYDNLVSIEESLLNDYMMSRIDEENFHDWCNEQGYIDEQKNK